MAAAAGAGSSPAWQQLRATADGRGGCTLSHQSFQQTDAQPTCCQATRGSPWAHRPKATRRSPWAHRPNAARPHRASPLPSDPMHWLMSCPAMLAALPCRRDWGFALFAASIEDAVVLFDSTIRPCLAASSCPDAQVRCAACVEPPAPPACQPAAAAQQQQPQSAAVQGAMAGARRLSLQARPTVHQLKDVAAAAHAHADPHPDTHGCSGQCV